MATPIPNNHARFSVAEILDATSGTLRAQGRQSVVHGIASDTRALQPGSAFVALRGSTHDGHDYVEAAAAAGASLILVERDDVTSPTGVTVVQVPSTLRALGELARFHARRWRSAGGRTLVGITGSAGKTTTRLAVTAVLSHAFPGAVASTRGNLNNRIGLPMVLLELTHEHHIAVIEMGTSEPGEITELCRIAEPDVGVVTLVAAAHLLGLGSVEDVAHEKAALFRALPADGLAIGNGDDPRVRHALGMAATCRRHHYGRAASAEVRILRREPLDMTQSNVTLVHAGGTESEFLTPLLGEAGALACAAAVAVAEGAFGVAIHGAMLSEAFENLEVGAGAGRLRPAVLESGLAIIDDTYNANPASMVSSIRAAAEIATVTGRRLVLVLGEMRELGSESARGHDDVGLAAAESGAKVVAAVGGDSAERMAARVREAARGTEVLRATTAEDAAQCVLRKVTTQDLVLIKGSRAMGTERVVAQIQGQHGQAQGRTP